jgi:hypothetical protein
MLPKNPLADVLFGALTGFREAEQNEGLLQEVSGQVQTQER